MAEIKRNIELHEARQIMAGLPAARHTETIPLQQALWRVCARDVEAQLPHPPFNRSPFDGYAYRAADTALASRDVPAVLRVSMEIPAGDVPVEPVLPGCAAKILTGAPIPDGADAVIKFEETEFTDTEVRIFAPVTPGKNIVLAGEDYPHGRVLVQEGSVITPAMIGIMASQGMTQVKVFRKPVVAIINTGSELVQPGQPLPYGKIFNSNTYTLQGYITDFGAECRDVGIVTDDPGLIVERIDSVHDDADLIITTGGASVGDYDFAFAAAEQSGGEILFYKIDIRPGGSLLVYLLRGKPVLCLSGNPGAAALGLLFVGLPYIRKLCGRSDVLAETKVLLLKHPLNKKSPRTRVLRGHLEISDGKAWFVEDGSQGGGDLSSLAWCNLIAEIPAGSDKLPAGTPVRCYYVGSQM
ncbi:MAG: molybdopterin molybdotransferase MoeA [Clostridiales Family XIII bacterium]|jgi:molybdopterin molybdotransferase|nr:molybdopterin molybdotransferase MoeA [Clostridiales Family XIII bacterium]